MRREIVARAVHRRAAASREELKTKQKSSGSHRMRVEMDEHGMINHARVRHARSTQIERGKRTGAITGIVVHQTDADTSASSLNSYRQSGANGAHFLIDKDGTIYQTAAIYQRTNHVGPLKARCLVIPKCKMSDFPPRASPTQMHRIEMLKAPADRYPSNMEAIGIEMVGRARLPASVRLLPTELTWPPEKVRAKYAVFETPTAAQNQSLSWLVRVLQNSMQIAADEVFRHPVVSRKNPTEAQGADWNLSVPAP